MAKRYPKHAWATSFQPKRRKHGNKAKPGEHQQISVTGSKKYTSRTQDEETKKLIRRRRSIEAIEEIRQLGRDTCNGWDDEWAAD